MRALRSPASPLRRGTLLLPRTLQGVNARGQALRWLLNSDLRRQANETVARAADDVAMRRLEAVLFMAQTPLTSRKLAKLCSLTDGTRARTLLRKLNEKYDAQGYAFRAEDIAGGVQLLTRPRFAPWLGKGGVRVVAPRLSAPAMETLAVVAYLQPVLRADVEAIRGVQCGELLKQLMARDLVRISGRSEVLGRPYLYATTKTFLVQFGLKNLDDLPQTGHPRRSTKSDILPPASGDPPAESSGGGQGGTPSADQSSQSIANSAR